MKPGDLVRSSYPRELPITRFPGNVDQDNPSDHIRENEVALVIATTHVHVLSEAGKPYIRKEILCLAGNKLGWATEQEMVLE